MYISRLENGEIKAEMLENVNFDLQFDLVCVGAGCAGIYAADSAARENISVLLIENGDAIGGMHICGNVGGYYYGYPGGSFEEDDPKSTDGCFERGFYRWQQKQMNQLDRLKRSGVDLRTRHTPTGVIFDGERAVGISVFDGERELLVYAKIVIDATSDGHLIRMCKAEKHYGEELTGGRAPFTVRARYMKDGRCVNVNRDFGAIDQYDSRDFSKKILIAHKKCADILPLGELLDLPARTGVREGISFVGEETLTCEDILFGREKGKTLFYAYSDLDRHGRDKALYDELVQNWWVVSNLATVTRRIAVPFGCIVPKGIKGLVTAGRCFSADPHAVGAVRMVRDMFRMGECVGIAAALAAKDGCDITDIDYAKYLIKVRERGSFDGDTEKNIGFDFPKDRDRYTPVEFSARKNIHLLKTETPGVAVWSCYLEREDKELTAFLRAELSTAETDLYRYNLAIALGIMGDTAALPTLRETVRHRDCFYFKDCRRSNQFRSAVALCLLARLGEPSDIPLLSEIVFDPAEIEKPLYHTLPPDYLYCANGEFNFVYFDHFTHAAVALVKIHERHALPTDRLAESFRTLLESGEAVRRIAPTQKETDPIPIETVSLLEKMIERTEKGRKK